MKLEDELRQYDCCLSAEEFEEILEDVLRKHFPDLNTEQLLYYPDKAKRYCDLVREKTNCWKLPDEMILRRLQNIRKRGQSDLGTSA